MAYKTTNILFLVAGRDGLSGLDGPEGLQGPVGVPGTVHIVYISTSALALATLVCHYVN